MRASCSICWARFRQVRTAKYSVADSASHTITVITMRMVSCWNLSETPNSWPMNESL